ncbi:MAG: PulJ/GspJ family protein, partial [Gammaproteobacteria bacterium]
MRANEGFTLLELMVAIMLFAMVSLMAYSGLTGMITLKQGNDRVSERLAEIQLAWLLIRQDMQQALTRPVRGAYDESSPALSGGESGSEW